MRYLLTATLMTLPAPGQLSEIMLAVLLTFLLTAWMLRSRPVAPRTVRSRLARLRQAEEMFILRQ